MAYEFKRRRGGLGALGVPRSKATGITLLNPNPGAVSYAITDTRDVTVFAGALKPGSSLGIQLPAGTYNIEYSRNGVTGGTETNARALYVVAGMTPDFALRFA